MNTLDSFLPLLLVLMPLAFGALILFLPEGLVKARRAALIVGSAASLALATFVQGQPLEFTRAWAFWGMDFSLKMNATDGALTLAACATAVIAALYTAFGKSRDFGKLFDASILVSLSLAIGALIANNLVAMLFFWQAMWAPLFAMIRAGGENAWKRAVRAVFTAGLADLTMILGIGFSSVAAESMTIDHMHVEPGPLGAVGYVLLAIGAIAKVGAIPFHGWLYDSSEEAPESFMALIPGGLNLLMGANLLSKLPGMFDLGGGSWPVLAVLALAVGTALISGSLSLTANTHRKLSISLVIAEGGALILGATSKAGGAFAFAAIFAAAAGFTLLLTGGAMDESGEKKPSAAVTAIYWLAALVASAVIFGGAMVRVALHDGILDLILAVVALTGALFGITGAIHLAHVTISKSPIVTLPEPDGLMGWIETTHFDPYPSAARLVKAYSNLSLTINDAISWFYDVAVVRFIGLLSSLVKRSHNGSQSRYVVWVLAGAVVVVAIYVLS